VLRGPAQDLHDLDVPSLRCVRVNEVDSPAVVLGSTQPNSLVDPAAVQAAGGVVARRRSGGGAVWLAPGAQVWLDLVIPSGDPLCCDDVMLAFDWVGDLWRRALETLVPGGRFEVHRGAPLRREAGRVGCFAGLSPGEVVSVDPAGVRRKVVGVSQRRTRSSARFQTTAYMRWDPAALCRSLGIGGAAASGDVAAALEQHVEPVTVEGFAPDSVGERVVEAVLAALPS
jgi:lipoate-protein ligase A